MFFIKRKEFHTFFAGHSEKGNIKLMMAENRPLVHNAHKFFNLLSSFFLFQIY